MIYPTFAEVNSENAGHWRCNLNICLPLSLLFTYIIFECQTLNCGFLGYKPAHVHLHVNHGEYSKTYISGNMLRLANKTGAMVLFLWCVNSHAIVKGSEGRDKLGIV